MQTFKRAFEHLECPFAWLDLNALDANIDFINQHANGKNIRIATKSIRSKSLLTYISSKLHSFSGWMTFTAEETLYLLEEGHDHFLIGYPVMEPKGGRELAKYVKEGKDITFMVDDVRHIQFLQDIASEYDTTLHICIDINLSMKTPFIYFGTRRSSLDSLESLANLLAQLTQFSNILVKGLMGYEAQIAGVGDKPFRKWQTPMIRFLKNSSKKKVSAFRKQAVADIRQRFSTLEIVNGGGSGSLLYTAAEEEVTEVTIGSAFFAPALFDHYHTLHLQPAAGFALRVTRNPASNIIVCHGGGYIASGAVGKDKQPVPYEQHSYEYYDLEGAGEVQTPLHVRSGLHVNIGDTVYFRHAKAGELCERFLRLEAKRGDQYIDSFMTYRGEGKCFL
ncbi:alanine racemase [Viridibacillus sp. YIM B01967]|uniref:Alanine racemase n=1 Tax=Viridibacillus soli TaxID=2798301 RepID=A0ABS1H739_9BACL|nr:alanine racemase [Viridibacillus soli]MBK3495229.1 alanine racemase [Viridibacillus soli]